MSNTCNESIIEQLYTEFYPILRNFIYYKFGDRENAEDMAQNAFIKLWENCEKVDVKKAKSFLFTIAVNLSLNNIKHQKIVLNFQKSIPTNKDIETPEFQLIEKEFQVKIQKALAELTEKQREVFLLNRIEKVKYVDIADMLNISVKAVEKRMHAALIVVRKKIGNV